MSRWDHRLTSLVPLKGKLLSHEKDELFLSGRFFKEEIPKNKRYLFKYFTTPIEKMFVRYFLLFETTLRFTDRTGFYCSERYLRILKNRFRKLEAVATTARASGDFEKTAEIESGNYPL